jgi:hypothetical protein
VGEVELAIGRRAAKLTLQDLGVLRRQMLGHDAGDLRIVAQAQDFLAEIGIAGLAGTVRIGQDSLGQMAQIVACPIGLDEAEPGLVVEPERGLGVALDLVCRRARHPRYLAQHRAEARSLARRGSGHGGADWALHGCRIQQRSNGHRQPPPNP